MSRALIVLRRDVDRSLAVAWIKKAPLLTRVEFKGPRRTLPQNDHMWAMLTEVSRQKEHCGKRYTPDQWKAIFMEACSGEVQMIPTLAGDGVLPWGWRSSELSKEEMSDLIMFIQAWGDQNGVIFK
jgi:NinB protein